MLFVPCMHCYTAVRVLGDTQEISFLVGDSSEFWPDKYKCITCGELCIALFENDVEPSVLQRMKVRDLTAQEYYAALFDLGTPDEMHCDSATVCELFTKKVKAIHGNDVRGTTRFIITHIEFEDGIRLYLAGSPQGAVVYRIVRPLSYTQKVIHER